MLKETLEGLLACSPGLCMVLNLFSFIVPRACLEVSFSTLCCYVHVPTVHIHMYIVRLDNMWC